MAGRVFTIMAQILDCLCDQLDDTDAGKPCFCGMILGTQTMPVDACLCTRQGDHCGTAWVRLDTAYPSASFPQPDLTPVASCQSPLAYRVNVGVVRCQPGLTGQPPKPPPADALILATQTMINDQRAAYRALACCQVWGRGDSVLGGWLPVGAPDGLCAGGYWTFTFRDLS